MTPRSVTGRRRHDWSSYQQRAWCWRRLGDSVGLALVAAPRTAQTDAWGIHHGSPSSDLRYAVGDHLSGPPVSGWPGGSAGQSCVDGSTSSRRPRCVNSSGGATGCGVPGLDCGAFDIRAGELPLGPTRAPAAPVRHPGRCGAAAVAQVKVEMDAPVLASDLTRCGVGGHAGVRGGHDLASQVTTASAGVCVTMMAHRRDLRPGDRSGPLVCDPPGSQYVPGALAGDQADGAHTSAHRGGRPARRGQAR
jgi:hypothetical protein